jgi:hypothetical protein
VFTEESTSKNNTDAQPANPHKSILKNSKNNMQKKPPLSNDTYASNWKIQSNIDAAAIANKTI